MTDLEKLAAAVQNLAPADLARFRQWFLAFDTDAWDRQLADDLAAGRLDDLLSDARRDYQQGRVRDL